MDRVRSDNTSRKVVIRTNAGRRQVIARSATKQLSKHEFVTVYYKVYGAVSPFLSLLTDKL